MSLRLCPDPGKTAAQVDAEAARYTSLTGADQPAGVRETCTQVESLAYLTDLVAELKDMASRAGFGRLERILSLAHQQAIEDRAALEHAGWRSRF